MKTLFRKVLTADMLPGEVTEEEIDQAIHDICVLEERITDYIGYADIPKEEIIKLKTRQRDVIINLLNGKK